MKREEGSFNWVGGKSNKQRGTETENNKLKSNSHAQMKPPFKISKKKFLVETGLMGSISKAKT